MIDLQRVSVPNDGRTMNGFLARPDGGSSTGVVVIHEWWGLNKQMEDTCRRFAQEGYLALGVDLFNGQVTDNAERAREMMLAIDKQQTLETLFSSVKYLRLDDGCTGKVAGVGFCFGGAWSLDMAIARKVDAAVIYYGNVDRPSEEIRNISCPLLGHFGLQDTGIKPELVREFEGKLKSEHKDHELHWYPAGHAFANPERPAFHEGSAELSWTRTIAFLRNKLNG
ncbi:MAG TPA: dienelactone hydrolase family protein [Burkholderiales bacterium]|nr:dienelactone hydrolase family protein [Burkholderiales bacterium]